MANQWGIPDQLERKIRKRDKRCVYCGDSFKAGSRRKTATWEHIDNDERHICEGNIVLCCRACNSSKNTKTLKQWLRSSYCKQQGIGPSTVAGVIKKHLS